jgi:hypothetical protein
MQINDSPINIARLPLGLRKHLKPFDASQKDFPPCIYFLCKNGQVSYIGLSTNFYDRIRTHIKTKSFDFAVYLPCPKDKLLKVESFMIKKYKPYLNGNPRMREWFKIERLPREYDFTLPQLRLGRAIPI